MEKKREQNLKKKREQNLEKKREQYLKSEEDFGEEEEAEGLKPRSLLIRLGDPLEKHLLTNFSLSQEVT